MKIIAIDTSTENCSVALLNEDSITFKSEVAPQKHAEIVLEMLDTILKESSISKDSLDGLVLGIGPGSFTGIRIGIASIKAMAEVYNIRVAGVTSLETLARIDESNKNKICLIDARNNQVYLGIFDKDYNKLEEYKADDINNLVDVMKKYENSIAIGSGAILHKELLEKNIDGIEILESCLQTAENTGKIGYKKNVENSLENADTIMPFYLRKSQAERMKK